MLFLTRKLGEEIVIGEDINETGQAATGAEALAIRALRAPDDAQTLRRFADALPYSLPRRRVVRQSYVSNVLVVGINHRAADELVCRTAGIR